MRLFYYLDYLTPGQKTFWNLTDFIFKQDQYEFAKMMLKTIIGLTESTVLSGVIKPIIGKFNKFRGETSENNTKQISFEYD